MSANDQDKWHIRLPSGESRTGTLEQLDQAFQSGAIDESTEVRADGDVAWTRLGVLLGLEPASTATAGAPPASAPPVSAPPPSAPVSAPPPPVVADLDDLDLAPPAFKSSRGKVLAAIVAAGAVGAIAISVAVLGATRAAAPAANVAAAAGAALPPNANAAIHDTLPATDDGRPRLTEAQKKALLEADKEREQKAAERHAAAAPHHFKSKNPFHKGGSAYNPLNGKL